MGGRATEDQFDYPQSLFICEGTACSFRPFSRGEPHLFALPGTPLEQPEQVERPSRGSRKTMTALLSFYIPSNPTRRSPPLVGSARCLMRFFHILLAFSPLSPWLIDDLGTLALQHLRLLLLRPSLSC
jgi:hypothetical protein